MAGARVVVDERFLDKNYLQYLGHVYISSNLYEADVEEIIRNKIGQLFFGGAENHPGPQCDCCSEGEGAKCANDDDCILRSYMIECNRECGEQCQNQQFTRPTFPDCLHYDCKDGLGIVLVTSADIPKGLGIVELIGRFQLGKIRPVVLKKKGFARNKPNTLYCFPIGRFGTTLDLYLDQEKEANESRFIRHSQDPNCQVLEMVVGRELRLLVIAIKDISAGSMLTIRYPQILYADDNVNRTCVAESNADKSELLQLRPDSLLWEPRDRQTPCSSSQTAQPPKNEQGKSLKKHKEIPKFKCHVANCKFRYNTEEEQLAHFEKVHCANIPEIMKRPPKDK